MIKKGLLFCASCLVGTQIMAGTQGSVKETNFAKLFAISAGPAWYQPNNSQTVILRPDTIKGYVNDGKTHALASGELFFGLQYLLRNPIYSQFGLAVAYSGNALLNGDILEDNDPNFTNYYFRYKINHTRLGLKGKLLSDLGYRIQPYVSGGIYVAFNQAYDYSITPKIIEEPASPSFSSHTTTAFAYTVGIGAQMPINDHWQLSIGYECADIGQSRLGQGINQISDYGIQISNFYTHQAQLGLTYLI